jgi:glycosyltransferase involved in cell wall biosynthesis
VTDDPRVFARYVAELLSVEGLAEEVGDRAAAWVSSHYDFQADVARAMEIYRTVQAEG